jgi:hypothetical protein
MALWGNKDNVGSTGTVSLNYSTRTVTGTATSFGIAGGCSVGDVIRFGIKDIAGTYFGDASIIAIASSESLTIGSTMGLSGVAIAGTDFQVSQLPKSTILDVSFSETNSDYDKYAYGIGVTAVTNANETAQYGVAHAGWVGVTTYVDNAGELRVKSEVLVAGSGIHTGNQPLYPPT